MTTPTRMEANTARVETGYGSHYVAVAHLYGRISHAKYSSPGKFDNTAVVELLDKFFDRINRQISASQNITEVHMPEFVLHDHAVGTALYAMFKAFIGAINLEITDIAQRWGTP